MTSPLEPAASPPDEGELLGSLRSSPVLGSLDEPILRDMCAGLTCGALAPGKVLFEEGEAADALYFVLDGELEAYRTTGDGELVLSRMGAGTTVGEIQILTGGKRTASVRAATTATLACLARDDVYQLARSHSGLIESIAGVIRERLRRDQLVRILPQLFGSSDEETLREVEGVIQWVHLLRGEQLLCAGDKGTCVYINVSGRLRAVVEEEGQAPRVLNDIEAGELVGEMAVFTGSDHSYHVYALRDTELARIGYEEFEGLVQRHPRFLRAITAMLIQRLEQQTDAQRGDPTIQNVVVLPLAPDVPISRFTEDLAEALGSKGTTLRISSKLLDERMEMEGAAQLPKDSPHGIRIHALMEQIEAGNQFVVYQADAEDSAWTKRCLARADQVLLLGLASGDPAPGPLEQALLAESEATAAPCSLVLLHPDGSQQPSGTQRWLDGRRLDLHHHVRMDTAGDYARIARFLSGTAIGLALSGGGARGMAHIGVIAALLEAGVPIDFVGGTSAGGAMAMQMAMGLDKAGMKDANYTYLNKYKPFRAYNVPIVSLMASRRMTEMLHAIYGTVRIEDLWLNAFAVSCSLSDGKSIVHRTGEVWRAVRASTSLPGILAPFVHEGRLLVDGGVVDNLPGKIMRDLCGGPVILVDVSPEDEFAVGEDQLPTSGQILWSWMAPHKDSLQVPTMGDVIVRTSTMSSLQGRAEAEKLAILHLAPPIEQFGMLEFSSFDTIVEAGYTYAKQAVADWAERDEYIAR